MTDDTMNAGVIGVGSMGQNHVRVYDELAETNLIGVFDVDDDRAATVASEYGTTARSMAYSRTARARGWFQAPVESPHVS